ncbi:putative alpha beta-hydrolase protein [Cladophialophora carrionii]|uniref:Putative alpha beta-hydrolase protein n=1 Tax=Cladophialophora carrionii TaxID=86049 RepID=A0A1C1CK08_9EURO|nr:putative alpha beta-hydrolase protein [Cladophialophora carrionii]
MSPSPLTAGKHTATLNGLRIHYTILADSPDLPPILVHPPPWGVGAELYINTFARLASKYTVIIPSPRGNDDSDRPASPTEMSSRHVVSDLEALREHLGLDAFPALIGHSSGGTVALGYAIAHPTRVRRLVLLNSDLLGFPRQDVSFFHEVLGHFAASPPTTDETFRAFMLRIMPLYFAHPERRGGGGGGGGGPVTLADLWTGNPSLWAYGAYYAADSASPPGEGAPGDGNAKWKQVDELGNVAAATLVLTGREDRVTGPEVSARIAAGVRQSRLVVVEACGHMSWVERPSEVWGVVDEFLAQEGVAS